MGGAAWAAALAFLVWNAVSLRVDPARVARGVARLGTIAARAFPPDFQRWGLLAAGMLESVEIATLSTVFGVLLALPVAVLAARNVVPLPVYGGGRAAVTLGRTFHAATGAARWQILVYAVLPQVRPVFAGVCVYRWDINIRESTVLGLVGAGGIGFALNEAILGLEWSRVGLILVVVLAVVVVSEAVSALLRGRLT